MTEDASYRLWRGIAIEQLDPEPHAGVIDAERLELGSSCRGESKRVFGLRVRMVIAIALRPETSPALNRRRAGIHSERTDRDSLSRDLDC